MKMKDIGKKIWAIAEGYIPRESTGPAPEFTSHETACILNVTNADAHVEITIFYSDKEPAGPFMHFNQLAALDCVFGFALRAVLHFGQRNAHLLRHQPHRFRKADLLALLHKLKNVARLAAAKAMEKLPRRVDGKRRRLFSMKRAQPNKILRAGFLELYVVANYADNVRLLPHRFFKVAERGHGMRDIILLEKSRKGNARTLVQFPGRNELEQNLSDSGSVSG